MSKLFVAKSIEIVKDVVLEVLFDKEMNLDENVECFFKIKVNLSQGRTYKHTKKYRYVYEDKMVSIEDVLKTIMEMIQEAIKSIRSLNEGINLTDDFYLDTPGIDNSNIEIDKELLKSIENVNEYKLQPIIIELYITTLILYKGSDTLQKRKYEKMIEAIEDINRFNNSGGRLF